ncbi:MAG: glycoside hydrolase family 32 protein [Bacteroidia bacterium]|nr:glycoside hydrolase family 32 protein [Bacteroidia bacterium]
MNKVPYKREPANALYWVGDFVNEKFVPDNKIPQKLEVINQLLSPSVTKDANGLTTAIAIIPDLISSKAQYEQGWTHLFSMPRVWTLKDGKICQQPHPVMKSLRGRKKVFDRKIIYPGKPVLLSNGKHQLEIEMEIRVKDAKQFGFIIGKHPQQKEMTKIFYDTERKKTIADQTKSSLNKNIPLRTRDGDYILNTNDKLTIRLFIDGSVVEVFINDQAAFTTRIFPLYGESNQVELFTEGGTVVAEKITVWEMRSAGNKTEF